MIRYILVGVLALFLLNVFSCSGPKEVIQEDPRRIVAKENGCHEILSELHREEAGSVFKCTKIDTVMMFIYKRDSLQSRQNSELPGEELPKKEIQNKPRPDKNKDGDYII